LYLYLFSLILVAGYFLYYFHPKFYIKKEIFKRVWKFYLLGIIGNSFSYIAQIFQKEYGSYKELASLSIALLFIAGLSLVGTVLIKFALPKLHEFWRAKDISNISTLYITHTFLTIIINLPILIFLIFFIDVISEFMGSGYSSLPIVLYILSIGYIFDLLTGITGTILRVTENEHIEIYNEIFRFGLGIGLLFFLRNQGYGVAWAISASMVIYNVAKFFQVYRLFKIIPLTLNSFKYLILLLFSLSFVFFIVDIIANNVFYKLVCSIVIMFIFYAFNYKMSKKILDLNIYK
jgi:O-antigen/teichoic acid export membrane protein